MKQNIHNNKLKFHMINDKQNSRGTDQSNKLLQMQSFGLYNRIFAITNDLVQSSNTCEFIRNDIIEGRTDALTLCFKYPLTLFRRLYN